MKEILFRGKCLDDGTWVEGYYLHHPNTVCIGESDERHEIVHYRFLDWDLSELVGGIVDPDTVCQYTGLNDRTGRKIFEHDIISVQFEGDWWSSVWYEKYEVYFSDNLHAYRARNAKGNDYSLWEFDRYCTVIGNAIDNPKLMEE